MTQELRDKVVSEDHFMLTYCHDKHKTQKMCDKAVDSFPLISKFAPGWFITSEMIEKLDSAVFSNDYI